MANFDSSLNDDFFNEISQSFGQTPTPHQQQPTNRFPVQQENSYQSPQMNQQNQQFNNQGPLSRDTQQQRQEIKKKRDFSKENISSEVEKTYFQKFVFDSDKYSGWFQTNTKDIKSKVLDAFWPFEPEKKLKNDEEVPTLGQEKPSEFILELYGPIWILITLVIEFSMVGHFKQVFTSQEHELQAISSESIKKVSKTAFFFLFYFFACPFVLYMTFKSKQAFDVTYARLFQIYGYAYTVFIPATFIYALIPLTRLRFFLLVLMGAVSLQYLYRELKGKVEKYLDDMTKKNIVWFIGGAHAAFLLAFKYWLIR